MTEATPPWEPPLAGTDAEHLAGSLDRLRATFRWKTDGLDKEGLTTTIPSSELSLGVLLKHLALVEDDVMGWRFAGQTPVTQLQVLEHTDVGEWQFTVYDNESAEQIYRCWDEAVARSQQRFADAVTGGLDRPGYLEFRGHRPSLRRHVYDLIEEYGRHTGHADLLREAIDGRVGEDPPGDWRPSGSDAAGFPPPGGADGPIWGSPPG